MKNQFMPAMEHVCSNDKLRPVMSKVLVTKKYFVATNAHVMVWHATEKYFDPEFIENIPDKGFLIHKDLWKLFKGADFLTFHNNMINILYSGKPTGYIKPEINGENENYPAWENVVPEANNTNLDVICINPNLLALAKKAITMGNSDLALAMHFTGKSRGILLRAADENLNSYHDAAGLIMPVKYNYDIVAAAQELQDAMDIVNA